MMETKLPEWMLKTRTSEYYLECLSAIPENVMPNNGTRHLGQAVIDYINSVQTSGGAQGDKGQQKKAISGGIFELMMAEMLVWHGLTPFYMEAEMRNIPASKFDFLCFHPYKPVLFSTKISLAERWRQVAFEGDSLKRIYRNASCYLVAAKDVGVQKRNDQIERGEIYGIDKCLLANSQELEDLLRTLQAMTFEEAQDLNPVVKYKQEIVWAN